MRILFVEPNEITLYCFRREMLEALLREGHEVDLCVAVTERIRQDYQHRVHSLIDLDCDLKNKSVLANLKTKRAYKKIIHKTKPDLILSYTIKPNLYCGYYAKKIPMIANITGLGTAFNGHSFLERLVVFMYKKAFRNVSFVMFQNQYILDMFIEKRIPLHQYRLIPGSGVNLDTFAFRPLDPHKGKRFLFASRMIRTKGFHLLIEAIPFVIEKHPDAVFTLVGRIETEADKPLVETLCKRFPDNVRHFERTTEMLRLYYENDFLVSPSFYREGVSNVLLESLACGRPIITTQDNPGCMELLDDGNNGIGIASRSLDSLVNGLIRACETDFETCTRLGANGRTFVESHYSRELVVKNYFETINELMEGAK